MYTANLGDSGFLLIRDGEVVHRSVEQQHYFNTPFQLGVPPPEQEGFVLNDRYKQQNRISIFIIIYHKLRPLSIKHRLIDFDLIFNGLPAIE